MSTLVNNTRLSPEGSRRTRTRTPISWHPPIPFLLNCTSSSSQGHPCFIMNQILSDDNKGLCAQNSGLLIHCSFISYENKGGMSLWLSNDNILHNAGIPLSGRHLTIRSVFSFKISICFHRHRKPKSAGASKEFSKPLPSWIKGIILKWAGPPLLVNAFKHIIVFHIMAHTLPTKAVLSQMTQRLCVQFLISNLHFHFWTAKLYRKPYVQWTLGS